MPSRFSFVADNSDFALKSSHLFFPSHLFATLLLPAMLPQRSLLRVAQRPTHRFASVRSAARRFNHSESKLPSWAVDNEFNRERAAVKHHAAATSGT